MPGTVAAKMAAKIMTRFLLVVTVGSIMCETNDPIVTVKQGKLKGAVKQLPDGAPYYSFKGIPYAQAPVGNFRFMAPRQALPWKGVREAISHGPVCPQYDVFADKIVNGSEDCLSLNVYTKTLEPSSKTPVMVFVHGGSYISGSGDAPFAFGPEFLLQHNVILVTINYRLEALGFLTLDTPDVPGNAGMKDQVLALRWVKNNIAKFGGDPDNVTLFGESAGAASAVFHLYSPMSKGLFRRVIAQSGVSINDWAEGKNGKQRAFRLGKLLGKDTTDTTELLDYLRNLPATKLANTTFNTMTDDEKLRTLTVHFAPVVEKKFPNVEAFLTEDPLLSLQTKKLSNSVPLMLGYTSVEGLIMVEDQLKKLDFTNANIQSLVTRDVAEKLSADKIEEFGERIRNYYIGNRNITKEDGQKIAYMFTDIRFVYNVHRFSHFYSSIEDSTYLYRFSPETDLNVVKNASGPGASLKGACHGDDLFYLFYSEWNKDSYEQQEKLKDLIFRITKLWVNFASTGNPTPDNSLGAKWLPYTTNTRDFFDIDQQFSSGQNAEKDRIEFWNKLYSEAGLPYIKN